MLSTKNLILNLNFQPGQITVKRKDDFDFNDKNKAYLLLSGEIISYGERNYTQLLKKNDPIGFAESILNKKKILKYKRLTDIILLEFKAKEIRDAVNDSNIVVKAIIKYSLARIFFSSKSSRKSHYLFEDEFLNWLISNHPKAIDFSTEVLPELVGKIYTYHTDMFYIDIGTPSSLEEARRSANKKA